jgi:hypothetical protein
MAIDYSAKSYDEAFNSYYYYSQLLEYDVVNVDFMTVFVFQVKTYRYFHSFHTESQTSVDQTIYLIMDDQSKDIVFFQENEEDLKKVKGANWYQGQEQGSIFQFLKSG